MAVAVDWSGAAAPAAQRRAIWWAEASDGRLVELSCGLLRHEVVDRVLDERPALVGLDLSFSLPAWWLDDHGLADGPALWAATDAERVLADLPPPFWGREPRLRRPPLEPARWWRACEASLAGAGWRPSSTFQVGGAGSVGTGSVRGWAQLARLRAGGVAVWPFDPPAACTAVEVWPRLHLPPGTRKASAAARARVAAGLPADEAVRAGAAASADALDAAVAALALDALAGVPPVDALPAIARREGWALGA